jgi:hypothetical protein
LPAAPVAFAHKASDAFPSLSSAARTSPVARRSRPDLALGLDANADGALTRARRARGGRDRGLRAGARLLADGSRCALGAGELAIDRHSDGAHAVLPLSAHW